MVKGDVAEEHHDLHVTLLTASGEDAFDVVAGPEVASHLFTGHLLGAPAVLLIRLLNEVEGTLADHHLIVEIVQKHGAKNEK